MRSFTHARFVAPAFALAALITAPSWIVVNDAIGRRAFYLMVDGQDVAVLVLLSLGIAFAAAWLLGTERRTRAGRAAMRVGIAVILALAAFAAIAIERNTDPTNWVSFEVLRVTYGIVVIVCLGLIAPAMTPSLARVAIAVLSLLSPVLLVFMLIAARAIVALPWSETSRMPVASSGGAPRPGRLVFLLYDELDVAYLSRAGSGRVLPAFDRLRRESRSYTQAQSPVTVHSTHLAVPTLLTGNQVSSFDPTGRAEATVTFDGGAQARWSTTSDVLSDAARAGLRVGIAGWYFPYCRFFVATAAKACAWQSITPFRPFVDGSSHLSRSAFEWIRRLAPYGRRAAHVTMVKELGEAGLRIASDPAIDIAFVHLPIPHFPYFYNGATHSYGLDMTTYEDNLVGADDYLSSVRQRMEDTGVWDATVFVVTSDHPFRGGHGSPNNAAGGGNFVPLMIRAPGSAPAEHACVSSRQSAELLKSLVRYAGPLDSVAAVLDLWNPPTGAKCSSE